jgi:hypothetical protein
VSDSSLKQKPVPDPTDTSHILLLIKSVFFHGRRGKNEGEWAEREEHGTTSLGSKSPSILKRQEQDLAMPGVSVNGPFQQIRLCVVLFSSPPLINPLPTEAPGTK